MRIIQLQVGPLAVFCYIAYGETDHRGFVIDPGSSPRSILSVIRENEVTVDWIINTHCHMDHTAGNAFIKKKTGAKIVIHELDAGCLRTLPGALFSPFLKGRISPHADRVIHDGDTVTAGVTSLKVIETPGHTPGGISLYGEGNLFTGDTLFTEGIGRTDLKGGSFGDIMHSIQEKIFKLPPETVIWPGHNYGARCSDTVASIKGMF